MATALCLDGATAVAVPVGPFGDQVARLLADRGICQVVAADRLESCFASGADAVIVAMWRPCLSLCERADGLAFGYGLPWLPVVMEHPRLRVGPWIDPPLGPCHDCYQGRRIQHDVQNATTGALEAAYDRDPACGPQGYLPHHARLAAGIAELTVRRRLAQRVAGGPGPDPAGELSVVNVLTWNTARHRVVARHGCPRCHPKDEIGSAGLAAVLATLSPREPALVSPYAGGKT